LLGETQFDARRAAHPTALLCAREAARAEEAAAAAAAAARRETGLGPGGPRTTYECDARHTFVPADMRALAQHPQYPSRRTDAAAAREVAARDPISPQDARLAARFAAPRPADPTPPHLLREQLFRKPQEASPDRRRPLSAGASLRPPSCAAAAPSPAERAARKAAGSPAEWASVARVADTTGLVPRSGLAEEEEWRPARAAPFASQLRRESPFRLEGGQLRTKDTHAFSSPLQHGASAAAAPGAETLSAQEEALRAGLRARDDGAARGAPATAPNWAARLKKEWRPSDMFSMLSATPTEGPERFRTGGSARRAAPPPGEIHVPWACAERMARH
jgi:hypothetical protein